MLRAGRQAEKDIFWRHFSNGSCRGGWWGSKSFSWAARAAQCSWRGAQHFPDLGCLQAVCHARAAGWFCCAAPPRASATRPCAGPPPPSAGAPPPAGTVPPGDGDPEHRGVRSWGSCQPVPGADLAPTVLAELQPQALRLQPSCPGIPQIPAWSWGTPGGRAAAIWGPL